MKILVIEDSPAIFETISLAVEMRWPKTTLISTSTGLQGIDMVAAESPDFIILDLGLPDVSGFEVLKRIRRFSEIPILILTVRSEESDIVKGLEWGADDYMVKPFKQLELMARMGGIMRRRAPRVEETLSYGKLRFEPISMRLTLASREVKISRTEGIILGCLIRNSGNVVSYSTIADAMWGVDFLEASDSIKVHIRHLRKKLEENPDRPKLILNKPGIGYFLGKPDILSLNG